ncbi:MAG: protein kinase, partial [Planctomycetales bacterium]|nr:protein kinase [Planctomycetales bacterium]
MNVPADNGSKSQPSEDLVRAPGAEISTSSGTVAYVPQPNSMSPEPSQESGREDDRTVISQRPVAAPEEFYRSMPLSELAGMLEGRQLDHFAVDQMIGGGGMGAVFRGRDLRLDRVVAIKVIPSARRDPETLRRFRLEAQAAAKLDHPNIARVYYVGEAEQWNYIVFEFIDGVNIRDLVEMEGPLGVDDAVYYTRQVAEALQHAYDRDVVHRDIKPSNVLVTAAGAAKVVDMGLARSTALDRSTADETASGVTLGTFDYISPEQARNPRDADVRSDLYSLGCTLFYMLTGNPPFPEGTALQKLLSHGSQTPPDPRGWREDLSDELFEITMKLMAKRPGDRYQTPTELISDLVMLAEVENLPRSQSPGTMLVPNHSAQASLLEANLPWLVAVAFLLTSTILWLVSVQTQANTFIIGPVEYPTSEAEAVSAASDPTVAANDGKSPLAPAPFHGAAPTVNQAPSLNASPSPARVETADGSSGTSGAVPPVIQSTPSIDANSASSQPAIPPTESQDVAPSFGQAIDRLLSSPDTKLQSL